MTIFEVALESFIDMNHELVLLSKQIDWEAVESEFAHYYCVDNGRPSVPIRKMVGMMLLKNIYNLSDEGVAARWMENPYMQYFTGEKVFQKRPPMNPIDMTKFRKRMGAEGAELRREDIQDVPVICITSEVRASDDPELFEKDTE